MEIKCSAENCDCVAVYRALLLINAVTEKGSKDLTDGYEEVDIGVSLCEEHKNTASGDTLLTKDVWNNLAKKFYETGKIMPVKERSVIAIVHIM